MTSSATWALMVVLCVWAVRGEESFCDHRCSGAGLAVGRGCRCDKACLVYDDCCSDAKYLQLNRSELELSTQVSCKGNNARVIGACSAQWKGPDFILKSCEGGGSGGVDPVGDAPVTSRASGATYANYHCAICNGDAGEVWSIQLSCPQLQLQNLTLEEAFDYLFYNHPTAEWGYVSRDDDTKKTSFHGCALAFEVPEKLRGSARHCGGEEEEVRTCPPEWKLDTVRDMCARYSDPVFAGEGGRRYRNFYCAVCNGVDQSILRCGGGAVPRTSLGDEEGSSRNKLSFSMLLDIDFSEGNSVGKAARCLKGEVFDPFARRCRNVVCGIPGFVLQNGLCVPADRPPL